MCIMCKCVNVYYEISFKTELVSVSVRAKCVGVWQLCIHLLVVSLIININYE